MTRLRRRMREDLQLAGYSPRTVQSYLSTVIVLGRYYNRSPALLTEEEIRQFFIYMINERKSSASSITVYLCGIKFFYGTTLKRAWQVFDIIKTLKPSRRGELEITDVNNAYIRKGELRYSMLDGWWTDSGTFDSLLRANNLVAKKAKSEKRKAKS